jgi:hypothetical protein
MALMAECTCASCEALREKPPRFVNVGTPEETMNHHISILAEDFDVSPEEMRAILAMAARHGVTDEVKALITQSLGKLKDRADRGGENPRIVKRQ